MPNLISMLFYPIIMIFSGNEGMYKSLDMFKFPPDKATKVADTEHLNMNVFLSFVCFDLILLELIGTRARIKSWISSNFGQI